MFSLLSHLFIHFSDVCTRADYMVKLRARYSGDSPIPTYCGEQYGNHVISMLRAIKPQIELACSVQGITGVTLKVHDRSFGSAYGETVHILRSTTILALKPRKTLFGLSLEIETYLFTLFIFSWISNQSIKMVT